MVITSTANEKLKSLRALFRDKATRYESSVYVAEGATIVCDIDKDLIKCVYIRESEADKFSSRFEDKPTYIVKNEIFDAVCDTKTPSGIVAVVAMPEPKDISGEIILGLCGVSDAGNVGAIIRTACARGIGTVVCLDTADPYSPKAVRASMGGITKTNVILAKICDGLKIFDGYELAVLDMDGEDIFGYERKGKLALLIGNEAHGVPEQIKLKANVKLAIPMQKDGVESLNAAVAAGIAMYAVN